MLSMSLTNAYFNVTFGIEAELPESFSAGTMRVCTDTKNVYLDLDSSRIKLSVTAEQLETARTIRTNLASTTAASFDGTNNITPGVTGTLPVANGGTGATSASAARTALGAAAASHGTHVTYGTGAPKSAGTASAGTETTVSRSDHVHPAQTTVSGNAGSATKLATSRSIDGVNFNGTSDITHYGTCSTAAATAAKVVSCTGFKLATGSKISVKFTVTNTAASPTLNVNSTGAKAIRYRGSAISAGNLAANRVYTFVYDGTAYELIGDIDTNTTYSTGTATTAGLTKLYTSTGTAADGTMTQNAITTALNGKSPTSHIHSVASTTANGFLRKLDGSTAHFMRGDGTWATPPNTTYSTMKGATSSAAGSTGLVPAPAAGKHTSFLRGDGTWATPPNTTYSNMTGATSSAAGKAGLVPAPAAGAATRYLRSDGTWSVPPDTNTTYTLSSFGITATAAELNKLDGVTTTATELNYVDGVTSNIQTQLNGKLSTSGTAAAATKLATARTISLSGDATGSASFNGTANATINATVIHHGSIEITTPNQNLNSFTDPGWYYCSTNATAATLTNSPTDTAFTMFVSQHAGINQLLIEYMANAAPHVFMRNYYADTWGSWYEIYHTGQKPTASEIGAAASSHNHSAANITSGTLPITRGGTGATTASGILTNLGITATATELNYTDGVTSNIQTQLNNKQATVTGGASTITSSNLTTNRALIANASGKVAASAVTATELSYLDGVTSNIQTQLNNKQNTIKWQAF